MPPEAKLVLLRRIAMSSDVLSRITPTPQSIVENRLRVGPAVAFGTELTLAKQMASLEQLIASTQQALRPALQLTDKTTHARPATAAASPQRLTPRPQSPHAISDASRRGQLLSLLQHPATTLSPDLRLLIDGLDLSNTSLGGASLEGATFRDVSLSGVDLRHAVLRGASIRFADTSLAVLDRATLAAADLTGANLRHASLEGADLTECNLSKCDTTPKTPRSPTQPRTHTLSL